MIMIDTDVLIWHMRGNPRAREIIAKQEGFFISVVTYMELVQGMRNKLEMAILRRTLSNWRVKILYITEGTSAEAMFLVEQHYLSHTLMLADALIASTAISSGVKLLTGNAKQYRPIKNLTVEPFKP